MKIKEKRTCATWRENDRHVNDLSQKDNDSTSRQETRLNSALLYPLVQIACVVNVGVLGVMIVVLIGHDEVLVTVVI